MEIVIIHDCNCNVFVYRCASGKKKRKSSDHAPPTVPDCTYEYAKSLIWRGLGDRVRREAKKMNNGPDMIRNWRWDIPAFLKLGHTKYMILGHRMTSNLEGATSEKTRQDMTWNRTVNMIGGSRNNIPIDQHMEHVNKAFKGNQ